MENTEIEKTEETKEIIIGQFKPKRKFLNFVSAVNGARIRFIRDIAFIKGEKLSGVLEGIVFKVTICDEGTINFEEVDTNRSNPEQIKRLIDDIDSTDVTGYAQKFVVAGLEFTDVDGGRCYLEVEHKKPINKLASLFDDEPKLSDKGASLLDDLFGDSDDVEPIVLTDKDIEDVIEAIENPQEPNEKLQNEATSYMEEQFRKMNEDKVKELKKRIEDTQAESIRLRREISQSESKLKKTTEDLGVLETRLSSFNEKETANGYVFFVSDEQKPKETGLTEENRAVADKIADILGLKKEALFKMLTQGYYTIKIAEKDNLTADEVEVKSEVMNKILLMVLSDKSGDAKVSQVSSTEYEYRGSFTWHQLVQKMISLGFEQDPQFDKLCNSNSYKSLEEEKNDDSTEI